MRRLLGAFLVLSLLQLGGCGDDDAASTDTEPAAQEPDLPGEDELSAGLLTADRFPSGWAEVPDDGEDDPLCGVDVGELLGLGRDSLPEAEALFAEDADIGPAFGESIGFVPAGRGSEALTAAAAALDGCEDEIDGSHAVVTRLSLPRLGDESFGFRLTFSGDNGSSAEIDFAYARRGDLLLVLFATDLLGDATSILTTYAPEAIDKAAAALL